VSVGPTWLAGVLVGGTGVLVGGTGVLVGGSAVLVSVTSRLGAAVARPLKRGIIPQLINNRPATKSRTRTRTAFIGCS
jgi:hypothetical protein